MGRVGGALSRRFGGLRLEKTQESGKNQWRQLWGNITNISTSLGTIFLPVMESVLGRLNQFLGVLSGFWKEVADIVNGIYQYLGLVDTAAQQAAKKREIDLQNERDAQARAAAATAVPGKEADKHKSEAKGWMGDVQGFWRHLQEGAWQKPSEKLQQQQLQVQQQQLQQMEKMNQKLDRVARTTGITGAWC